MAKRKSSSRRISSRAARTARVPVSPPAGGRGPVRNPVIVTFKPKEKRRDKTDKVEIVKDAISSRVEMLERSPSSPPRQAACRRVSQPEEVGFDVNMYEAPIVALSLTYSGDSGAACQSQRGHGRGRRPLLRAARRPCFRRAAAASGRDRARGRAASEGAVRLGMLARQGA